MLYPAAQIDGPSHTRAWIVVGGKLNVLRYRAFGRNGVGSCFQPDKVGLAWVGGRLAMLRGI